MTDVAAPSTVTTTEPSEPRARRRGIAQWFADQDSRELLVWGVLIALTILVRVIGLANRPFHHDESQDAYFSYLFRKTGDYEYNPLLHGPLRFYLTGAMYFLFGDTSFTARLAPVLMGFLMIPMCWGLRGLLGRGAAFFAALLFAVGPSYLYFSRFAREDIYVASLTLALLIVIWRFLDHPRKYHPALIGALLALSFSTKETTFITVFVMGSFFLVALAIPQTRRQVWRPVSAVGWEGWGWCIAAFAGVFTVLFTTFLTHPGGLYDGVVTGLKYWLSQQDVARGGEPWKFYSVVLVTIEWPAILLGIVGAVSLWRKHMLFTAFLIWDFLLSLAVYSWAGEKFAWLVLHPLLPLVLLAGAGVQGIWEARGAWRVAGFALAGVCAVYVVVSSWWVNVDRGADPREMLVSTQSATDVRDVANRVLALAASRGPGKPPLTVTVDAAQGATFPYAWYWRHLQAGYIDESLPNAPPPTTDVVTLTDEAKTRLQGALGAYDCNQYQFRIWWVRDYGIIHAADHTSPGPMRPGNVLKYILQRKTWNPTGGMKEWLCVKKGV
jgi:uncharacterized protein (TIGR03663 family)